MKLLKKTTIHFVLIFLFLLLYVEANATSLCTLKFQVFVPDGFSDDLLVVVTDSDGNKAYDLILTHGEDYEKSFNVSGGKKYFVSVTIKSGNYDVFGINELGYDFSKNNTCVCAFTITEVEESASMEEQVVKDLEDQESIEKDIESQKAKVLTEFIMATAFIEDDKNYKNFLPMWKWDSMRTSYLTFNTNATDTEWTNLTEYEAFVFYFCYSNPYFCIVERNLGRVETLATLDNLKGLLDATGDAKSVDVYDACQNITAYLWDAFNSYGEFIDLYDSDALKEAVGSVDNKISADKISEIASKDFGEDVKGRGVELADDGEPSDELDGNGKGELLLITSLKRLIMKNAFSLTLLVVLLGVMCFYLFFRKDDRGSEKKQTKG